MLRTNIYQLIIPELLNYSTQAIYKTSGLKELLSFDEGEIILLKRLQALDIARSMLDSIIIDADGEEYDYTKIQFSGMSDIIEKSVNYLSAICSIPKAFLYGEKLGPWSKSDRTTTENWYNLIERIQQRMIKNNLSYLASVIFRAGVNTGDLSHIPSVKIKFHSLWQLKETEKADIQLIKAKTQLERAKMASSYFQTGAITPEEIRKTIAHKGL